MCNAETTLDAAIGEIASHKDYIAVLKRQLEDAGITPFAFVGPRGLVSYGTDNHVTPVGVIKAELLAHA